MTALRIATALVWLVVAALMLPAVTALLKGEPRRADPSRLGWFLVSLCFLFGNLRFLFFPENEALWGAIYVLSIISGLYVMQVLRSYGRGPRV